MKRPTDQYGESNAAQYSAATSSKPHDSRMPVGWRVLAAGVAIVDAVAPRQRVDVRMAFLSERRGENQVASGSRARMHPFDCGTGLSDVLEHADAQDDVELPIGARPGDVLVFHQPMTVGEPLRPVVLDVVDRRDQEPAGPHQRRQRALAGADVENRPGLELVQPAEDEAVLDGPLVGLLKLLPPGLVSVTRRMALRPAHWANRLSMSSILPSLTSRIRQHCYAVAPLCGRVQE